MPENGEIRNIAKKLNGLSGQRIIAVLSIQKEGIRLENSEQIEKIQSKLPLQIRQVKSRGQEFAILSSDGSAIVFNMGTSGFSVIVPKAMLRSQALLQHANSILIMDSIYAVVICEALQTSNQIVITLQQAKSWWDKRRSPDIMDEPEAFLANLKHYMNADPEYFKFASLYDILHNQSLFNGIGDYTTTEILHLVYEYLGLPPSYKAWGLLSNEVGRSTFVNIILEYFKQVERFLANQNTGFCYLQPEEMDFERIFVRVHKRHQAILLNKDHSGNVQQTRVPVHVYGVSTIQSKKYENVECSSSSICYSTAPPAEVTIYGFWTYKGTLLSSSESQVLLQTGVHSWFSVAALKLLVECPLVQVKMNNSTFQHIQNLATPPTSSILNASALQQFLPPTQESENVIVENNNIIEDFADSADSKPPSASQLFKKAGHHKNKAWRTVHSLVTNLTEITYMFKALLDQKIKE